MTVNTASLMPCWPPWTDRPLRRVGCRPSGRPLGRYRRRRLEDDTLYGTFAAGGVTDNPGGAARGGTVDGASTWKRFWLVTLPLLKPTILVALLFRTLDAVRVFDLIFVLTGGGPGFATESMAVYTYRVIFQNLDFGYGSTLAVVNFLYVLLISLIYIKILGARVER